MWRLFVLSIIYSLLIGFNRAEVPPNTTEPTLAQLSDDFKSKASSFLDTPIESVGNSPSEEQQVADVRAAAKKLVARAGSEQEILAILNDYKSHAGFARDALCDAIPQGRDYQRPDLPFLKSVFLLSLDCKEPEVQFTHQRLSARLALLRFTLGLVIYSLAHPNEPLGFGSVEDRQLFGRDPKAWLQKVSP